MKFSIFNAVHAEAKCGGGYVLVKEKVYEGGDFGLVEAEQQEKCSYLSKSATPESQYLANSGKLTTAATSQILLLLKFKKCLDSRIYFGTRF